MLMPYMHLSTRCWELREASFRGLFSSKNMICSEDLANRLAKSSNPSHRLLEMQLKAALGRKQRPGKIFVTVPNNSFVVRSEMVFVLFLLRFLIYKNIVYINLVQFICYPQHLNLVGQLKVGKEMNK